MISGSLFFYQNWLTFLLALWLSFLLTKAVKALRLYLDTGDELLKHLSYADSYDTLYACVIGNTVNNAPIETSVKIILPDLKRYDSLLKGGDAV